MAKDTEPQTAAPETGGPAPDLRLLDRRAFVGFPPLTVAPGLVISDFALQIPDVSFPFNLTGGALRYQRKTLNFGLLDLSIDAEVITRRVAEVSGQLQELEDLKLHFRPGYLEGQARFKLPERTPFTFKAAFDGDGDKLAVYLYDVRLYGFSPVPAPRVSVLLSRAISELELLPEVELRGATGFSSRLLPQLCQLAAVSRGFRVPLLDQARLTAAEVSSQGLRLRFASGGLPPPTNFDEELLLALEGSRAFADAEALVAQNKLAEAREAYLRHGDASEAHPFAAERLLALLVADPQAHEMALDVAASILKRRDRSAAAQWAEAVVRERRGEGARAAERYLALCALARKGNEETAAFFAAEAAARAGRDRAPQMAVKALHELLGIRPDHLPSLKALARASDLAKDRAGAIRAYRRIAALARDPAEAAEAHVQMARLCAETEDDIAGARLHCEAALRLSPDHPDALYQLGELTHRSGEHLRAIRALDRLREVAMARHDLPKVGWASLLAGKVWESGLKQPENALLRYREAASLLPSEPEPHYLLARAAEGVGKLQEALTGYQQAVELAGPGPTDETVRKAAHASLHALSKLHRTRLGDPAKARELLEAALALDPKDTEALEELIPYFRATGRNAELADACEKAALVTEDGIRRANYWAEAGETLRTRLGNVERAERLLTSALEADPRNRMALEGLLALAEGRRDGAQLCRCLRALAELSTEPADRARLYRRLAVAARDLAFDLELATLALNKVLELEPNDLAALGELCALHRRRADMAGLAQALDQRAKVAEVQGDRRLASAALRELAQVLEVRLGRVGEALVAMEKAARLSPDQSVLLELADLSLRCERPQHARRAFEDVLSQLARGTSPERVADIHARLGRACEMLDDVDAAIEHYALAFPLRRLDDALTERLEALYVQTSRRRDLGELWYARAQALAAAERRSHAAPLFVQSAEVLLERGEREAALIRFEAALEADPEGGKAPLALERMAELELGRGNRAEAARHHARRAALLKEDRDAARLLFQAAALTRDSAAEETFLDRAIERDGAFAPARLRRAELLGQTAPDRALVDLEAVLASNATDPDAPPAEARVPIAKLAAEAAFASNQLDAARRHLVPYVAQRPDDLDAQRELVALHRRAGALEQLADVLSGLWKKLPEADQLPALRELAQLSLELRRNADALSSLRQLLSRDARDGWAARALLPLLPPFGQGSSAEEDERLALLSVLISQSTGEEAADWLARRAEAHHAHKRLSEARADYAEAAKAAAHPRELLRKVAELSREANDEKGELSAWQTALARAPELGEVAAPRLLAISRNRFAAGDFAAARDGFTAAVELPLSSDDRCEAWFGLAEAAVSLGDRATAANAWNEAASSGPARRRLDALLRRAELLESGGALAQASETLVRALELSPRHPGVTESYKRVLRSLKDFDGLAEVLADEANAAPRGKAAPLFEELGYLYLDALHQPSLAEAAFLEVVELEPKNVDVRRELADLLFARHEGVRAAELLEEAAAAAKPEVAGELLWEGARRARQAGEKALFLRLSRAALPFEKPHGDELASLVEALYEAGAVKEALPLARQLADEVDFTANPDRAERAHLVLAELAEQADSRGLAEKALRKLVAERPLSEAGAEKLAALLSRTDAHAGLEVLWAHAQRLPATEATSLRMRALAARAKGELRDVELAAKMLERAAEISEAPLPVHQELAALLRESNRRSALMTELAVVARLLRAEGQLSDSISALEEAADLAEQSGQLDEALSMLEATREMLEQEKNLLLAARVERRRAELLRDARLDLPAAEQALEKSFSLSGELYTARLGAALARHRDDAPAEALWLERAVPLCASPRERAGVLLEVARLFDGPLGQRDKAEDSLREALRLHPESVEAERMLVGLLLREGRLVDVAALKEEAAQREADPVKKVELLMEAAHLYRDRAGRPDAAAAALLAARAVKPDDLDLTARVADLLHEAGRGLDAADFDAVLLEADPFRARVFERHVRSLEQTRDYQALAALLLRRAERQDGVAAAKSYLAAAQAFRQGGAMERALLCEDQAFEAAPESDEAYQLLRERAEGDVRRLAELLAARARVLPPTAAVPLLRERAERLSSAGELLKAAAAYDDLLAVAGDDVPALAARAELAARDGGPVAAQPYDRRLLSAGGESLPLPLRLKTQLRLGHAAVGKGALRDAADAFEAVVTLDPDGDKGSEALSLLAEVHARTQNTEGLYRTSLRLAKRAKPGEEEALLRRAADLFDDPKEALDALLPLARLRPTEPRIIDRAADGLRALGRYGDLLELFERGASAAGGPRAAELLLAAAQVAEAELSDGDRAYAFRARAGDAAPQSAEVLRELAQAQRRRGDGAALGKTLERLIELAGDTDEAAPLRLERAKLARDAGDDATARQMLDAVLARGTEGAGYLEALQALLDLCVATQDAAGEGRVLSIKAELAEGEARAALLLSAAKAYRLVDAELAVKRCREALLAHPTVDAALLLAQLHRDKDDLPRAAEALVRAASLAPVDERGPLLLKAAHAREARGNLGEAANLFEKVSREHAELLSRSALADHLLRLNRPERALEVGFEPALEAGELGRALALADWAQDAQKAQKALWALVEKGGAEAEPHAERLAKSLREAKDGEGLLELSRLSLKDAPARALGLAEEVATGLFAPALRVSALDRLEKAGKMEVALGRVLPTLDETSPAELVEWCLARARSLIGEDRLQALAAAAEVLPSRARSLWLEHVETARAAGRNDAHARGLSKLVALEHDVKARSELRVELGELYVQTREPQKAKDAYEAALADDGASLPALKALVELYKSADPADRFVELAEKLMQRAGEAALAPKLAERLVQVYEKSGRLRDAYDTLARLEPTPIRLEKQASLALELGMVGDALRIREKLAKDPAELVAVLFGYMVAELIPFAVKLGERLLKMGAPLDELARRMLAEKASVEPEGAALAVRLWPDLLRENVFDADAWTLYAEALQRLGRKVESERMDGFGAALTGSTTAARGVALHALARTRYEFSAPRPESVVEVGPRTMPRLHLTLGQLLSALGAPETSVLLNVEGGVEAYLVSPNVLVIGAGALSCFGAAELSYLCALALALGERGHALSGPGPVEGLEAAAAAAFAAVPGSLAACRVLAHLSEEMRGGDPSAVDVSAVLKTSGAFRAIALQALLLV